MLNVSSFIDVLQIEADIEKAYKKRERKRWLRKAPKYPQKQGKFKRYSKTRGNR